MKAKQVCVLIDARSLNGLHNGIGRSVESIIKNWGSEINAVLISNRPIKLSCGLSENIICYQDKHWSAKLPGTIWLQLRCPHIAKKFNATHFLGTQNVLPLLGVYGLRMSLIIYDFVFIKFPETMSLYNRVVSNFFIPKSIVRANKILCVSYTTKKDLMFYFPIKSECSVCYPGKPDDYVTVQKIEEKEVKFIVVGSIEPRKNLAPFFEAFLLLSNRANVSLNVVSGHGWGGSISRDLWSRLSSCDNVRIHKKINDQELMGLYEKSDFLVFPSKYEGFGLPILEAVDKCSVIANDIPVFREISELVKGMHFIDFSLSADVIADALKNIIDDVGNYERISDESYFSWDKTRKTIQSSFFE